MEDCSLTFPPGRSIVNASWKDNLYGSPCYALKGAIFPAFF